MFSFINMSMGMYFTAVTGLFKYHVVAKVLHATIALQSWPLTDEKVYFAGFQVFHIFV